PGGRRTLDAALLPSPRMTATLGSQEGGLPRSFPLDRPPSAFTEARRLVKSTSVNERGGPDEPEERTDALAGVGTRPLPTRLRPVPQPGRGVPDPAPLHQRGLPE